MDEFEKLLRRVEDAYYSNDDPDEQVTSSGELRGFVSDLYEEIDSLKSQLSVVNLKIRLTLGKQIASWLKPIVQTAHFEVYVDNTNDTGEFRAKIHIPELRCRLPLLAGPSLIVGGEQQIPVFIFNEAQTIRPISFDEDFRVTKDTFEIIYKDLNLGSIPPEFYIGPPPL